MPTMGKYTKAYPVGRFREFEGWTENLQNLNPEKEFGKEDSEAQLTESDFFYLQENFTVTDGIFLDENIIFSDVTPEWIDFCKTKLEFEVPVYETAAADEEPEKSSGHSAS